MRNAYSIKAPTIPLMENQNMYNSRIHYIYHWKIGRKRERERERQKWKRKTHMNLSCNYIFNINNSTMELVISGFEYVLDAYLPPLSRDTFLLFMCVCRALFTENALTHSPKNGIFQGRCSHCIHSPKMHTEEKADQQIRIGHGSSASALRHCWPFCLCHTKQDLSRVETVYRFSTTCNFVYLFRHALSCSTRVDGRSLYLHQRKCIILTATIGTHFKRIFM